MTLGYKIILVNGMILNIIHFSFNEISELLHSSVIMFFQKSLTQKVNR